MYIYMYFNVEEKEFQEYDQSFHIKTKCLSLWNTVLRNIDR